MPPPPAPASNKGCWKVGCGGCLVVLLLLAGFGFFVYLSIRSAFNQPPFEPLELTPAEEIELQRKTNRFQALAEGEGTVAPPQEGFFFTGRELTAWLERENPDLANTIRISTEPDLLRLEIRLEDSEREGPRIGMEAAARIVQVGDRVEFNLVEIRMGPFRVPRFVMREIAREDLFQDLFADPEIRQAFSDHVERFEIRADGIWLMPRH